MFQPDDLDRKILKEMFSPASLQWNIKQSYNTIAKLLLVDEETIRRRFERMREMGVLQGWQIIINPHLIGCEVATFDLTVPKLESRSTIISQLKLISGVIYIIAFYDNRLRFMIYYPSESALERQIALMESLCESKRSMFWRDVFPPCNLKMTRTDWLIIGTLMKSDPRKKLSTVAHEAGVSSKTLNRRLHRMREQHAFFLDAGIDVSKLGGSPCAILVRYKDKSKKRQFDDLILRTVGNIAMSNTAPTEHSMFSIHCENLADAERIFQWIRGLDGVGKAKMGIYQEKITVNDWLTEEIERRARTS